jgi:UDP:flavonoid glycosyltransferase YjiC (YdhE family)
MHRYGSAYTPASTMSRPKRVLFFAEAVTLAHVARPIALAQTLDPSRFECTIACHPRYERFLQGRPWTHVGLGTIESAQFLRALSRGSPVYDLETLRGYVREDLALIDRHKPDVVVGDFRLSLSVSARLAKLRYVTITNAYWSPYYPRPGFPLPVLPMTKALPIPVAEAIFKAAQRFVVPLHCRPINRLRVENGFPSLGDDLRRVYTDADQALYADWEALFPTVGRPESHRYIGPLFWSPPVPLPSWWQDLPQDKPVVYVTLGSSGDPALLSRVLMALAELELTVVAATAGGALPAHAPANAHVADYLPGAVAAKRSRLVICNGGSMTTQQALAVGNPVIGLTSNMDQFLNMQGLVDAGLGVCFRADRFRPTRFREAVLALLVQTSSLALNAMAAVRACEPVPGWVPS